MRVAVVGGGIGGLAVALFLARRAHDVTVFERDGRRAGVGLDEDTFTWVRPSVPQAAQPHLLLAPVRRVLRADAPDVYAAMRELGAEEYHEFDWFDTPPPYRPGDEELVTVRARRIVLETALAGAVARQHGANLRLGAPVRGLDLDTSGPVPHVTAVRTDHGRHRVDLVLDCAGRRSPLPRLLAEAGCRAPVVESHRTGLAYVCRWYRLRGDAPKRVRPVSMASFASAAVFPSDNGVFAVALLVATADRSRGALRDPAVFDAAARLFPAAAAWLDLDPEPLTGVRAMAGLDNRWTALVDDEGPVVTGLVGVGDSVVHTNPTLGQGCSLALREAQWVAANSGDANREPAGFAMAYAAWCRSALRPWFDVQVEADRGLAAVVGHDGTSAPPALSGREAARMARSACAYEDPVVMRARAKVQHLAEVPAVAYADEEVRRHIDMWLEARDGLVPGPDGPERDEWLAAVGG
ncbi:FAD-dependent oxidoreductase [Streptodolium elevatio]